MFNFDSEKLVKGAKEGLQKAEKLGGNPGEAAKAVLQGLAGAEKAPEKLTALLRSLLAEAKKLAAEGFRNFTEAIDIHSRGVYTDRSELKFVEESVWKCFLGCSSSLGLPAPCVPIKSAR